MFDLTTGQIDRPFQQSRPGWTVLSLVVHTVVIAVIVAIPLLYATNHLPNAERIEAFIVTQPVAAPPPPPPPAPPARPAEAKPTPKPVKPTPVEPQVSTAPVAPVEAPESLPAEPPAVAGGVLGGALNGVEGGAVGGVTGGTIGGVVGNPLPPAPGPLRPVRVGGQITTPALVKRVEPTYPAIARAAKLTGTVILELTVDANGQVRGVDVLRSQGPLDQAAIDAVKQWRYSPLVLNGIPTPFVVTVTMNFSLRNAAARQAGG